ncbi:unnamed protein product, partial [Durusdinium trenchii]
DHPTVSKESWDKYFEGIILDECLDEGLDKGLLEVVPSDLPPSGTLEDPPPPLPDME